MGLLLAGAGFGLWYGLAPAVPEVRLDDGTDPVLVEAVRAARWEVRRSPWSDGPRGRLGMLLHVHAMPAEAAVCYAQAEQLNPKEPRWPHLHARVLPDDPPAALALLRRAAEQARGRPGAPDAPDLQLADACLDQGLFDEAEKNYRRLLDAWPDHPRARLGLARLAVRRGRADDALPHLQACSRAPATRKAAKVLMTEVCQRRGKSEDAAAAREIAGLPDDAPWPDPWMDEAQALLVGRHPRLGRLMELQRQGRLREAGELALKTTREYPDIGHLVRGRVLHNAGRLPEAEQDIREGLRLNPTFIEGHFDLGMVLREQKKYAAAAESFRRAIELEPAYGAAYRELGRCALGEGDRAEAARRFRQALHYMPQDAEAHRDLAEVLIAEGKAEEALGHLGHALHLKPDDSRARELREQLARGGKTGPP